jgi:peptide/nickel transport system substrate-binding protein
LGRCGFFIFPLFVFASCASEPHGPPKSNEPIVLRIGVTEAGVSAPDVGLPQAVRFFTVEGLTTKGLDSRPQPRLAKSWSSDTSGLNWTFQLRENVTFHDGTKLTAQLARDTLLKSLQRPGSKALYPGLGDIVDISAPSDDTVGISLKRRSAFLLEDLEFPITRTEGKTVRGTGPFKAVTETKDEVVLEPHRTYHQGTPRIDRVVIRPYETLRTAWASMMRQEIDVLWDVAHDSSEFVGSTDVAMHSYLRNYVSLIAFNSARPKVASPAVRRALNAAVDRDALIREVFRGRGLAANGPLWPQHWAYDRTAPGYTYDPSLASTTLEVAGVRRQQAAVGRLPARLSFNCLVLENYAVMERLALNVQKQLYDIGVDMQLEPVSTDEYVGRIAKSDFDAVIIDMISGPSFTRPYSFWRWGGEPNGYNTFGYKNPAADQWFDALRHASTEAEYRAAAGQLQRVLKEDPPALFLVWQERTRAISRRFEVPVEPGRDPIRTVWQWAPREPRSTTTH